MYDCHDTDICVKSCMTCSLIKKRKLLKKMNGSEAKISNVGSKGINGTRFTVTSEIPVSIMLLPVVGN
jgi:hypothetical protein